ncbi:MAG: hypothetical protein Q8R53_05765 [Nanoarchaeota archaeon]|nr:hypothetical protein [Nanoarchaeota archaeon]
MSKVNPLLAVGVIGLGIGIYFGSKIAQTSNEPLKENLANIADTNANPVPTSPPTCPNIDLEASMDPSIIHPRCGEWAYLATGGECIIPERYFDPMFEPHAARIYCLTLELERERGNLQLGTGQ